MVVTIIVKKIFVNARNLNDQITIVKVHEPWQAKHKSESLEACAAGEKLTETIGTVSSASFVITKHYLWAHAASRFD